MRNKIIAMKREKKLGIRRKIKSNICEFKMKIERLGKMIESEIGETIESYHPYFTFNRFSTSLKPNYYQTTTSTFIFSYHLQRSSKPR